MAVAERKHFATARRNSRWSNPRRQGSVILELLLGLPVLIIAVLAAIQFGMLFANLQTVAVASRAGSREAARTPALAAAVSIPAEVTMAVRRQLASENIADCRIILEHNLNGPTVSLTDGFCNCSPPATPLPGSARVVRVTVCAEAGQLTPSLLAFFGFDISSEIARESAVFQYEL